MAKKVQRSPFKYDLAACVLLEAIFTTDADACKKYGVAERTLRRYRQRQAEDPKLADLFKEKKAALDAEWAGEIPAMLREAQQTIRELMAEIRSSAPLRKNPMVLVTALEKAAGAHRLFADAYYTGKLIDARLAGQNRPQGTLLGQGTPEPESDSEYSH